MSQPLYGTPENKMTWKIGYGNYHCQVDASTILVCGKFESGDAEVGVLDMRASNMEMSHVFQGRLALLRNGGLA